MRLSLKRILIVSVILLFLGCETSTESIETEIQDSPTISQGIWGFIKVLEGDFMPPSTGTSTPVERKIYIYELTNFNNVKQIPYSSFYSQIYTDVIDSTWSNSKGFFEIELNEGEYSIFVKEDSLYYSNQFSGLGNIFPFTIYADSLTKIEFQINYKASY